jgi:hypothetical protein
VNDALKPLEWLLGKWEGSASGEPGSGKQQRRYELVLRGEFIMGSNHTIWVPKAGETEGEVHEDISVFSFDRTAGHFVMHMFYVERFVGEFVAAEQTDPNQWVFTAARLQNGPAGMQARETFTRQADTLDSRFDLAMPGKGWAPYTHETLLRVDAG